MKTSTRRLWPIVLMLLTVVGCAETDTDVVDDEPFVYIPEGKMDDYRSTKGREYALTAVDVVRLSATDAELTGADRDARVAELVQLRFKALSFFLYAYLADKSSHDANYGYGGFRTTVRQQTFESLMVEERATEPGAFDFMFAAEAGGPTELLGKLTLDANRTFELVMPKLTNAMLESGSYASTYKNFNPAGMAADTLETIRVEIQPKPSEPDAYPDYNALFEDGLLDVAIHVGGDYNAERYDLSAARAIFEALQADLGLTAPVATFEELTTTSGPFTGSFDANGKKVAVEVYLFHPDMQKEEGVGYTGLLDAYRASAAIRDIVLYDGHAGYDTSYSGIVVHYNPRYAIAAADFDKLELPGKYQIFFFNGCKTYTAYADALYKNPAKTTANLDVLTTVNFSWLSEMSRVTSDFLGNLIDTVNNTHAPRSYDRILADLNRNRSWDVIYGVHGLSDNGRISPYADTSTLCTACRSNSQCPGVDNLCVKPLSGSAACAAACTDDTGCPTGYKCSAAAASGSNVITATQCVPVSGTCP